MRWQCVECGREHDTRSGRCECGSTEFERTVVQLTKECTTCGEAVPESADSCPECGFTSFESLTDPEPVDASYIEWRCVECGREHPKNNPPCSRCGHMRLEKHRVEDADVADYVEGGSWREALGTVDRATVAGVAVAVLIVVAIGAFVPGAALPWSSWADDVNRTAVEGRLVAGLNAERADRGFPAMTRTATLDAVARSRATALAGGESRGDLSGQTGDCGRAEEIAWDLDGTGDWPGEGDPTASKLADLLVADALSEARGAVLRSGEHSVGAGTALADGHLYVTVVIC